MEYDSYQAGLSWQTEIWNRMSDVYMREIDRRFVPVIEQVIARAGLTPGERALDIGAGTGAVALHGRHSCSPGRARHGDRYQLRDARVRPAPRGGTRPRRRQFP